MVVAGSVEIFHVVYGGVDVEAIVVAAEEVVITAVVVEKPRIQLTLPGQTIFALTE